MSTVRPQPFQAIRRLSIVRPDNLGDVILFSGALRHLRAHYRSATVTVFIQESVRNLLEHCPHIDRLVDWKDVWNPSIEWLPATRGGARVAALVQRYRLNGLFGGGTLLVPVRSPRPDMHAVARMVSARQKVGISGDYCNQSPDDEAAAADIYTSTLHLGPDHASQHEFVTTQAYLKQIGIDVDPADLRPEFWTTPLDRRWAAEALPPVTEGLTIGLSAGATDRRKSYPFAHWARLFELLRDVTFRAVLLGTPGERAECEALAASLRASGHVGAIVNLAGQTTVRQLIEVLRLCDCLVGVDAAALHIAVALGRPAIGILGGGHFGRFFPWGDPRIHRFVSVPMDCYWCNWNCRYPTIRCIEDIAPEAVGTELRDVLRLLGPFRNTQEQVRT